MTGTNWTLEIENIGIFKDAKILELRTGLNLIVGRNASGKTSVVQALKLLNKFDMKKEPNLNLNSLDPNDQLLNNIYKNKPTKYLFDKTKDGKVYLKNSNIGYHNLINNTLTKGLEFFLTKGDTASSSRSSSSTSSSTKEDIEKIKKYNYLSADPKIVPLVIIDNENFIMEEVDYTGNLNMLRNYIMEFSNIKYYLMLLKNIKKLRQEYIERKEKDLKDLNDEHKKILLEISGRRKKLSQVESDLKNIKIDKSIADEYQDLMDKKQVLNAKLDKEIYVTRNQINEELVKKRVKLEKFTKELNNLKQQKGELEQYTELEKQLHNNIEKLKNYDTKLKELSEQKKEIDLKRRELNLRMSHLQDTLDHKENKAICEYCLNEINHNKIKKRLEELELEKRSYLDKIKEIDIKIKEFQIAREKLAAMIRDQQNIPRKIGEISKKINDYTHKIKNLNNKIEQLQQNLEDVNKQADVIKKQIQQINDEIISLTGYDESLKNKQIQYMNTINILKKEISELEEKEHITKKRIILIPEGYNTLIQRTEKMIQILNNYMDKFYLEFIDEVNEKMENLIEQLKWDFSSVFIDDNLDIIIEDNEGNRRDFSNLSTFERKSIIILFILIFKLKYATDYPLFVIDEHLNAADPYRLESFLLFLYKILKENTPLFIATLSTKDENNDLFFTKWDYDEIDNLKIYHYAE